MPTALLLSGGVDSSTALFELVRSGESNITAYYLKVWLEDELDYLGACPWEEDLEFARAVCDQTGVPLVVVPLQREYYERVVQYTIAELQAGRTPSPDIFCNQRIKFGAFFDFLADESFRIATGHYAQIVREDGHVTMLRSPDPVKDQTYFLSHLSQEQLQRIVLPIGCLTKREVRLKAQEYGLASHNRKDSQGICFLGKIRYPEFIRHYLGERDGDIVDRETQCILGRHRGYWYYTIGQRQGLGLGGGPWYVVGKEVESNVVFVSHSDIARDHARSAFDVGELTWTWKPPSDGEVLLRIRHGPELLTGTIAWTSSATLRVEMNRSDRGVAAGQFAVFYHGDVCLGAGKILQETPCAFS